MLPPTIRTVGAGLLDAGDFAGRVRAGADRLAVATAADVAVLGGGAECIWNRAADAPPQAVGAWDACHALGHIGAAVKAVRGESAAATARRRAGALAVAAGGRAGIGRRIADACGELPAGAGGEQLRGPAGYLGGRPTRPGGAQRLANGRSIGSGLVEGPVKQPVNRRMKLTGARGRVERVGPLAERAAVAGTPDWHDSWTAA